MKNNRDHVSNILSASFLLLILFLIFCSEMPSINTVVAAADDENLSCQLPEGLSSRVYDWTSLICATASMHNIPPCIVAGVMNVESSGYPDAISPAGAIGLMQVMPSDGIAGELLCASGRPCFENRPTMEELSDPVRNVEYATNLLVTLYERDGNWEDALNDYYGDRDSDYYQNVLPFCEW